MLGFDPSHEGPIPSTATMPPPMDGLSSTKAKGEFRLLMEALYWEVEQLVVGAFPAFTIATSRGLGWAFLKLMNWFNSNMWY